MKQLFYGLFVMACVMVLFGCKKDNNINPEQQKHDPLLPYFLKYDLFFGQPLQLAVDAAVDDGFVATEPGDHLGQYAKTVDGVTHILKFFTTNDSICRVHYLFASSNSNSYVADSNILTETIYSIGQNYTLPSGGTFKFYSFYYCIGEDMSTGNSWSEMVDAFANLGSCSDFVSSWLDSDTENMLAAQYSNCKNIESSTSKYDYILAVIHTTKMN